MKTETEIQDEIKRLGRAADASDTGSMDRRMALHAQWALQWVIEQRKNPTPFRVYD